MGLFDTLSGITLGDIWEGVSSIFGADGKHAYKHTDGTTFSEPVNSGGLIFSLVNNPDQTVSIQVFNPSDTNGDAASVFVPNDLVTNLGAVSYFLGPKTTQIFNETQNRPSNLKVTTGMVPNTTQGNPPTLYKISFAGLQINKDPIYVAGFTISCTDSGLLAVSDYTVINEISYFHFESNWGHSTTSAVVIQGTSNEFAIDFTSLGFDENDVISGQITLGTGSTMEKKEKKFTSGARPFNEAEKAYIQFLKERKQKKYAHIKA